jgi:hypothetical protein
MRRGCALRVTKVKRAGRGSASTLTAVDLWIDWSRPSIDREPQRNGLTGGY